MEAIALSNTALLLGAGLIVAGILSSLIATRFGAPILLMFLAVGMLAGEDGPGGIRFSDYRLTYLIGSLALAIILFDGGLRTRFLHVRSGGRARPRCWQPWASSSPRASPARSAPGRSRSARSRAF